MAPPLAVVLLLLCSGISAVESDSVAGAGGRWTAVIFVSFFAILGFSAFLAICTCCENGSSPLTDVVAVSPGQVEAAVSIEPLPEATALRRRPVVYPVEFNHAINKGCDVSFWLNSGDTIDRSQLQYCEEKGSAWFGHVISGEAVRLNGNLRKTKVVVKILREDASVSERNFFLHEASMFRIVSSDGVAALLGYCVESQPYLLVFEDDHMDLKQYLVDAREPSSDLATDGTLLRFAHQLAGAVRHLHDCSLVHGDLACHSCVVSRSGQAKIGADGLAFVKHADDYVVVGNTAVPLRWMAPETVDAAGDGDRFVSRPQTAASNVWSLGVLCWELFELARTPYAHMSNADVLRLVVVDGSARLPPPTITVLHADIICGLIAKCLRAATDRPTAAEAADAFDQLFANRSNEAFRLTDFETRWQQNVTTAEVVSASEAKPLRRLDSLRPAEVELVASSAGDEAPADSSLQLAEESERRRAIVLSLTDDELARIPLAELEHDYQYLDFDEIVRVQERVGRLMAAASATSPSPSRLQRPRLRSQLSGRSRSILSSMDVGSSVASAEQMLDESRNGWALREFVLDADDSDLADMDADKLKEAETVLTCEEIKDLEQRVMLERESRRAFALAATHDELAALGSARLLAVERLLNDDERRDLHSRLHQSPSADLAADSPHTPPHSSLEAAASFRAQLRLTPQMSVFSSPSVDLSSDDSRVEATSPLDSVHGDK